MTELGRAIDHLADLDTDRPLPQVPEATLRAVVVINVDMITETAAALTTPRCAAVLKAVGDLSYHPLCGCEHRPPAVHLFKAADAKVGAAVSLVGVISTEPVEDLPDLWVGVFVRGDVARPLVRAITQRRRVNKRRQKDGRENSRSDRVVMP